MAEKWFLQRDGNTYGPYPREQLLEYAREGRITEKDLVKFENMDQFVKAGEVPGLFSDAPPAAPPFPEAPSPPQAAQAPAPPPAAPEPRAAAPAVPAAPKKNKALRILGITAIVVVAAFALLVIIGLLLPGDDTLQTTPDTPAAPTSPTEPAAPAPAAPAAPTQQAAPLLTVDPGQQTPQLAVPPDMQLFSDPSLGFAVAYPKHWIQEWINDYSIIFSGPEGSDEYFTTVNIQNLASVNIGGNYTDLDSIYQDFQDQMQSTGGDVLAMSSGILPVGSREMPVMFISSYFYMEGEEFWQWIALVQRNENIFHQFNFTAPTEFFVGYVHIAEEMYSTFELINY